MWIHVLLNKRFKRLCLELELHKILIFNKKNLKRFNKDINTCENAIIIWYIHHDYILILQ